MLEDLIFEIIEVAPCIKDPSKIRFVAQANMELPRDVLASLSFRFPPALVVYDEVSGALTLKIWNRLITMSPSGRVGVTFTLDVNEAREVLDNIKQLLVEAEADLERYGVPTHAEIEARKKLSALRLYNYLPKTNCGLCGEGSCMAFAVKVLNGEVKLSRCGPLKEGRSKDKVEELKRLIGDRLLKALGWEG